MAAMMLTLGFAGIEGGVVLCFGGDGHLAIEVVGPDGCAEAVEVAAHAASAIAIPASSSHCGPCVDVALTAPLTAEGVTPAKRVGSAPTTVFSATPRLPIPRLLAAIPVEHSLAFISEKPNTVVIRC
jgi:hypothetical protein